MAASKKACESERVRLPHYSMASEPECNVYYGLHARTRCDVRPTLVPTSGGLRPEGCALQYILYGIIYQVVHSKSMKFYMLLVQTID